MGFSGDTVGKTFNITNSSVTVGGSFHINSSLGTFTTTGSTVTANGTALQTIQTNTKNFNNLNITNASAAGVQFLDGFTAANITDTTPGSRLTFKNGATYTVSGTMTLTGSSGNEISLLSDSAGVRFTLTPSGAPQTVSYVNVKDSQATTNNITANFSINSGGNDDAAGEPHWIFSAYTTLGDGASPASRYVGRSTTNRAVDAFTLYTSSGTDPLTGLTVTLSGTGSAADIATSGVKIWKDGGTVANEWDAGDTQVGSGVSISGTTATFTGLTEAITTTSTQYLITYDISAAATPADTLLGRVSGATVTKSLANNDTTDNTLTVAAVSGTVYTDEAVTNIGSGKTVRLIKSGASVATDTTDTLGRYAIPASVAAGDALLVYIDGDTSPNGSVVSVVGSSSISGFDIYGNRSIITRFDNGAGSLTSANMSTALGAYSDSDIEYTVPSGVLTASTGTTLYVPASHTFAPGANTSLAGVKILGTYTGGSYTHTVSASWNAASGTFSAGNSTLSFLLSVSSDFYPGASSYYNIIADANNRFIYLRSNVTLTNDFTLNAAGSGTLSISTNLISTKNFIWQSGYLWHSAGAGITSSANFTKTGGGFFSGNGSGLTITFNGSTDSIFTPGAGVVWGNITLNKDAQTNIASLATDALTLAGSSTLNITSGILDIAGRDLDIGAASTFSNTGTLRLQGGETITNLTNDTDSGNVEYNGSGAYGSHVVGNNITT